MAPEPQAIFKPGFKVEVSSDDDGFRGSWFTGTIVRRLANNKFLIEYDTLMSDEKCTKPLRETLPIHQLRPLQPPETDREFKFGDEVDAFHNDGWWEGHITENFGNGSFAVYFRVSREQIVFTKNQLRLHREWLDHNWVPPFKEQHQDNETVLKKEEFSVGALVEVSSDEDGFQGAWFCATVLEAIGNEKFLVEYESLLDDDDLLLKEEAGVFHIRPRPPETCAVDQFKLLDEVDAMHQEGWWVGVISKLLPDSRYIVYFRNSNEELEFEHSQLRVHQEWIDGKWVTAFKVVNEAVNKEDNN